MNSACSQLLVEVALLLLVVVVQPNSSKPTVTGRCYLAVHLTELEYGAGHNMQAASHYCLLCTDACVGFRCANSKYSC